MGLCNIIRFFRPFYLASCLFLTCIWLGWRNFWSLTVILRMFMYFIVFYLVHGIHLCLSLFILWLHYELVGRLLKFPPTGINTVSLNWSNLIYVSAAIMISIRFGPNLHSSVALERQKSSQIHRWQRICLLWLWLRSSIGYTEQAHTYRKLVRCVMTKKKNLAIKVHNNHINFGL